MGDTYAVAIEGLSALRSFDKIPENIRLAAQRAVNKTTQRAVPLSAREMERQVMFPRGYLSGQGNRLSVTKKASGNDLEGRVTGRDRPTSLARFIRGGARPGDRGVTVEVKPGVARFMPSAFVMKLRNQNLGLAVRTRNGRPPSMGAKQIGPNLYLLYGPSVDQVFVDVRNAVRGDLETLLEREFERLLDLNL